MLCLGLSRAVCPQQPSRYVSIVIGHYEIDIFLCFCVNMYVYGGGGGELYSGT